MRAVISAFAPSPIDVVVIIAPTPISTPSIVSKDLSLFANRPRNAFAKLSSIPIWILPTKQVLVLKYRGWKPLPQESSNFSVHHGQERPGPQVSRLETAPTGIVRF